MARFRVGRLGAAALLLVLLAAVYAFSIDMRASRGASITGDEPFYLLTTQSLIDDFDLVLTNQYEQRSYESFFDHPDGLWRQSVPKDDGTLLSPHNPGLSVFVIPGYIVGSLTGVQVQLLFTAALTFALTFLLVARITNHDPASWFATLAVGLTATPFIYATEVYPEVPAACCLVASLLLLSDERPSLGRVVGVALLLNALVWFGVKYAPLALIVAAFALYRADLRGRAALAGIGVAGAAAFVWFHLHTFGDLTPYSVNVAFAGSDTGELIDRHVGFGDRFYRLWGLFIDRRFGLLHWAPVLGVAIPGAVLAAKRDVESRTALALIGAQILIATFVAITMMGWWFPGRTMMTVVPLSALPIALVLKGASRVGRAIVGALGAYSVAITAALAYAGHRGEVVVAVDPFDLASPVFAWLNGAFPQYTSWSAETWLLTIAWLAALTGALAVCAWRWAPPRLGLADRVARLRAA